MEAAVPGDFLAGLEVVQLHADPQSFEAAVEMGPTAAHTVPSPGFRVRWLRWERCGRVHAGRPYSDATSSQEGSATVSGPTPTPNRQRDPGLSAPAYPE